MPMLQMYTKGITFLTGRVNSRAAYTAGAGASHERQMLQPELLTGLVAPWDEADRVFGERVPKVVFARD